MTTCDPVPTRPVAIHDQPPSLYDIALWPVARKRAAHLASVRLRGIYGAALDSLEEAWSILAPMALAARTGGADDAIARFVLDVVEEWRDVAGDCLAMVPGPHGLSTGPLLSESPDEMELIGRALVALGMASQHPEFPASLREPICYGMDAYRAWLPRYAATVKPIGKVEARAARPRVIREARRPLD
jgi:hypothetical protein